MQSRERLWATVVIWLAYMVVLGTFLGMATSPVSRVAQDTLFGITLVISAAAVMATYGVWGGLRRGEPVPAEARKEKRLDRERVTRLIEALDDDDVIELETLLMARERADVP